MRTNVTTATGAGRARPERVERPAAGELVLGVGGSTPDIVDVWGRDSFPASDPPANW